jgi:anti-sigma regulatory factor (Ser/Thr protein kinase)
MVSIRNGYPATAASVPAAREEAADCACELGADEPVVRALALAVTEACSNVVLHAYRAQDEPGDMTVLIEKADDSLWVNVLDDGLGLVPDPESPGLGLGLPLIAQFTDDLMLRSRPEGGSAVTMRFDLSRPRQAA